MLQGLRVEEEKVKGISLPYLAHNYLDLTAKHKSTYRGAPTNWLLLKRIQVFLSYEKLPDDEAFWASRESRKTPFPELARLGPLFGLLRR